jgi:hypothetical protein
MIRIQGLTLSPGEPEGKLWKLVAKTLRVRPNDIHALQIRKRSIDARKKDAVRLVYTVDAAVENEPKILRAAKGGKVRLAEQYHYEIPTAPADLGRPVVVGFGPAGMFAALVLAMAGARPIVIERGCDVKTRQEKVAAFWAGGALDPECNVQFGAGGAGTFSDGKLNTGTHDARISWVLEQLHEAGAQEEILYDAMPHVGTDVLAGVVETIDARIRALGGDIRYETRLDAVLSENGRVIGVQTNRGVIDCFAIVLAIGHSARDTVQALYAAGVPMEPKAFSMGVRIEHPQDAVSRAQYGDFADRLPPANYRLACHLSGGSSAYTFCMCPGGQVVAAASEAGGVVTNGMSYAARDGESANSALLVTLHPEDFPHPGALGGMQWQRELEQAAFELGGSNYHAPAQTVGDFLAKQPSTEFGAVQPSYRPGVTPCDLHALFPPRITDTLEQAIVELGKKLTGFDRPDAVLTAPETRSSSPVRILRDKTLQSPLRGLFPCGEGAGFAGGIVSAAVDGMRCAEAILNAE